MMNMWLTFTPTRLAFGVFFYLPDASPVSAPAGVTRATVTAAAAFRGRPAPAAALTSTSSARRQAPRDRHQGHQTDVVEAAAGWQFAEPATISMRWRRQPDAVRSIAVSRRHTAFLAISTAGPMRPTSWLSSTCRSPPFEP
ncbi:hypothetical protein PVAP13_2KG298256 [Panicum virgatum]|uniref:Secreted protein n=1 Tax=Panicum virgatum TaxID=38727 RepID=A0A8T0W969_PANVG|nr:hypothetical protein PVAP13_2KG298256 [Panicum virgatum]